MSLYPRCWAMVPAAGVGSRMGAELPKQYLRLGGKTVIEQTIDRLLGHSALAGVCVAISATDQWWHELDIANDPRIRTIQGGSERSHSVFNGLKALSTIEPAVEWVLVHDAARPCVRHSDIDLLIERALSSECGALLAGPVHDTVKQIDSDTGGVETTLCRERLWRAFTPQMFRLHQLTTELGAALDKHLSLTDESSALELAGHSPQLVEGHPDNIKITRPEDLPLAEFYLRQQELL